MRAKSGSTQTGPSNNDDWIGPTSDIVRKILPDALVRNEGSVWAFNPLTTEARRFFDENVSSEPWQWLGTSLVVEATYALGLIEILIDAGFRLG